MRRLGIGLGLGLGLGLVGLAAALAPVGAQQQDGFRPVPGRFQPAVVPAHVACLDTYTGRLHLAPPGEVTEGAAWVVDLEDGLAWQRPFARDVSAGRALPSTIPVTGVGAGAAVYAFEVTPDGPGAIDTRSGKVHVLVGELGKDARVVTTDLRTLARSVRPLRAASDAAAGGR